MSTKSIYKFNKRRGNDTKTTHKVVQQEPSHLNSRSILIMYITLDLTPKQQNENKVLRSKLADQNIYGKLYRMKIGENVQRET